jgi:hypothetical protein
MKNLLLALFTSAALSVASASTVVTSPDFKITIEDALVDGSGNVTNALFNVLGVVDANHINGTLASGPGFVVNFSSNDLIDLGGNGHGDGYRGWYRYL